MAVWRQLHKIPRLQTRNGLHSMKCPVIENKRWRQTLDAILQDIKGTARKSRERSLLITKLQEAIMWAGMDLKALHDGRTCYPDSYDPSNTHVAPNVDGLKM